MKTNAIVRIILFLLAILILLGILLGVLGFNAYRFSIAKHVETAEQGIGAQNITQDIRNIEINWVAGSITFRKDQNATGITVEEFPSVESKYKMILKQSGQTLKILYCDDESIKFPFGTNFDLDKDLIITVPMDWDCDSLEIDSASAEVILNDMAIQEFDFDGASGVCKMNNCSIGELDIDTASGDIHFSGMLETLNCDAVSADCHIEVSNIPRSVTMDGMSGNLTLVLPHDAGFACELDTMSGSFNTDFDFKMNNNVYICGTGECKINVSAMSGDASILKGMASTKSAALNTCIDPGCNVQSHSHTKHH